MSTSEIKPHVVLKPLASLLDVIDGAEENHWEEVQRFKRGGRQKLRNSGETLNKLPSSGEE